VELEPEPKLEEEFPKLVEEFPNPELDEFPNPELLPIPGPEPTGVLPAGWPMAPALPPIMVRSAVGS